MEKSSFEKRLMTLNQIRLILTQTDTAVCGTPGTEFSFAGVSGRNLRIESPLNNNSLFSDGVNARGPAYISFNSRPRT